MTLEGETERVMGKNNKPTKLDRNRQINHQVLLNAEIACTFAEIDAASREALDELDAMVQELTEDPGPDQQNRAVSLEQKAAALERIARINRDNVVAKRRFALDTLGRFGVNVKFAYPQQNIEEANREDEQEPDDPETEAQAAAELEAERKKMVEKKG